MFVSLYLLGQDGSFEISIISVLQPKNILMLIIHEKFQNDWRDFDFSSELCPKKEHKRNLGKIRKRKWREPKSEVTLHVVKNSGKLKIIF